MYDQAVLANSVIIMLASRAAESNGRTDAVLICFSGNQCYQSSASSANTLAGTVTLDAPASFSLARGKPHHRRKAAHCSLSG